MTRVQQLSSIMIYAVPGVCHELAVCSCSHEAGVQSPIVGGSSTMTVLVSGHAVGIEDNDVHLSPFLCRAVEDNPGGTLDLPLDPHPTVLWKNRVANDTMSSGILAQVVKVRLSCPLECERVFVAIDAEWQLSSPGCLSSEPAFDADATQLLPHAKV